VNAPHLQGPPRSTVADALAAIVAHYAALASRGPWAPATSYAVGDQVSNGTVGAGGWVYTCFVSGTSDGGSGPAGMGSQRDTNGVGWTPLVYVGERYLRQHGAPPRLVIVQGDGSLAQGSTRQRIGDGNPHRYEVEVRAFLWAAEAADDLARYTAIETGVDLYSSIVDKVAPGSKGFRTVNPTITANILTFGEDRQVIWSYSRNVPRDGRVLAVPTIPAPSLDIMRPNGDLGTTFTINPGDLAASGSR
jgi:hypothetical protein